MEAFLAAIEATDIAQFLRASRWSYAFVNAAHIFGIALLIGSIIPLQLRFLGLWSSVPRSALLRVLSSVAAIGLTLAVVAGSLLFAVRAREYAGIEFLQAKLILIVIGTLSSVALHRAHGRLLETASDTRLKAHAVISIACWIGALLCGRLIAFAGG